MARAGEAKYDVVAEDKFSRTLDKAGRGFSNLQAKVVTANAALQLGKFAADAFSAGLDKLYNEGAKVVDRQAKVAAAIQTTTEYLEAAQYAAGLNGISAEYLEKAYLKMTDAIGAAADGTATYKRALDKLGLNAETLKLKSTEEQYKAISTAMEGVGNQAERVQIARTVFGRQGAFLIRNTADQIEAAREEMDQFGISTSRVDASKVEAANDAMFKIQTVAAGAKKELAAGLAPAIETVAEKILSAAIGTVDFEIASQRAGLTIVKAIGKVGVAYLAVDGVVKKLAEGALAVERAFYQIGAAAGLDGAELQVQVITAQMEKLAAASEAAFKFDFDDRLLADYNQNIKDAEANARKLDEQRRLSSQGGRYTADEDNDKTTGRVNDKVAALQSQLLSEEGKLKESYTNRIALIEKFEQLNTDKKREASVLRDEVEREYIEKSRDLRAKQADEIAKEAEAKADKSADLEFKIAQLKGGFEAEKAEIIRQEEERQDVIREYAGITALTKEETDQLYIDSERRKVTELAALRQRDAANAAKIEKDKQASVLGYLDKGLGAAAGRSRKAFELQKALDIGRALIAGKVAAVEAFKWGAAKAGLAGGLAASAASLLATGSIIQSIGGRSFSANRAATTEAINTPTTELRASTDQSTSTNVTQYIITGDPSLVDRETFKRFVTEDLEASTRSRDIVWNESTGQFARTSEAA